MNGLDILLILLYLGGAIEIWNYKEETPWYSMAVISILWPIALGAALVIWGGQVIDKQKENKNGRV